MKEQKLTPKQERFCQEYLIDSNATQAAIRSGYSPKTAEVQGPRLLGNVRVAARIAVLRSKQEKRTEITADRVVNEIASIAFGSLVEMEGYRGSDKLKALEMLGRHKGLFVDKTEISGPGGGPVHVADISKLTDEELAVLEKVAVLQHGSSPS